VFLFDVRCCYYYYISIYYYIIYIHIHIFYIILSLSSVLLPSLIYLLPFCSRLILPLSIKEYTSIFKFKKSYIPIILYVSLFIVPYLYPGGDCGSRGIGLCFEFDPACFIGVDG